MMSLLKWQAKILNKLFKTTAFEQIIIDSNTNLQKIDYRQFYHILNGNNNTNNTKSNSIIDNNSIDTINNTIQYNNNNHVQEVEQIIQSANVICHGNVKPIMIRDQILKLNSLIQMISQKTNKHNHKNTNNINEEKLSSSKKIKQQSITQLQQQLQKQTQKYNTNTINNQPSQPQQLTQQKHYSIQHVIIYSSLSKCRIWPKMLKSSTTLVPSLIGFYNQFTKDFSYDLSYKFDPVILTHKYQKVMNKIQEKKKSFPQLFIAIQQNNLQLIEQLIQSVNQKQKQPDFINQCKKDTIFISHHAVAYSTLEIIRKLHQKYKLNFQKQDGQKQTSIFFAVKRNDLQIVKFLAQQVKVNINHKQYQHRTPIYLAAFQGNIDIVDYLYLRGANPQMQSKLSRTPLSKACYLGNVSVAEYLIKIGVNLTTIDSKGRTALHNAAWGIQGGRDGKKRGSTLLYDSPQCAELLLKAGHPVDIQDFDGFTPLMSAAASLAIKSMRILISHGANLHHKTKRNQTVTFVAAKYGHLQSVKILIQEFNCDYEQGSIHGISPFDASMASDSFEVAHYILQKYFKKGKKFTFQSLIKCLCYYKKQSNLEYLKLWAKDNVQKKDYIYGCLKQELQTKENFIADIFQNEKDLLPCFLDFIGYQISKLDTQIVQFIVDRCVASYKKGILPNFPQFLSQNQYLLKEKQVLIRDLQIQSHTKQQDIIKILGIDTNITANHKTVHRLMLFLVNRRMTKVLLWILTLQNNNLQKQKQIQKPLTIPTGMYKFTKKQIQQIVRYESQQQISIHNYCYINGIHDAVKILSLQLQQKQLKIYIPKYQYIFENKEGQHGIVTGTLSPVNECFFDIKYLLNNHLHQKQAAFLTECLGDYDKRIVKMTQKIQIVESIEHLENMREHFKSCKLIGIDIQHWNHSKEQFVCLVQVSGMGETFLIDTLKVQNQPIKKFLQELLSDEQKIKVFHAYDMDLKWIGQDFGLQNFKSVVDTSRIFGILNPKNKSPSLRYLADLYLSQKINKDFQRSDWRIRPLFKEMIAYAGTDALVLPFLFIKQLMQANVEIESEKDAKFFDAIRKQFGSKRFVKGMGRRNILKLLPQQQKY